MKANCKFTFDNSSQSIVETAISKMIQKLFSDSK